MRVLRHEACHAARPETRAEPIDEMRELGGVVRRRKSGLRGFATLGGERRKAHHVETEAGIELVADDIEPVGEQAADTAGLAQRLGGADLDAEHLAVGAEQRGLEQACAFAASLQRGAETARELLDRAEHVAFECDRIGEALLGEGGG